MSQSAAKRPAEEGTGADDPRQRKKAKGESAGAVETIQMPDGGRYTGQINDQRKPHGEGAQYRADGSEAASGQWRAGNLHGRCKRTYSNGSRYEGDFVDGKYSGLGMFTWGDGRVFEGEWADCKRSGLGVQWAEDGALFECGRWVDDELVDSCPVPLSKIRIGKFLSAAVRAADPSRTLLMPNGGHFVGELNAEFKQHGEGVRFAADGSESASGQWRNGKQNGQGKKSLPRGNRYEGDFVAGKFSGLGAYTWADGRVYEGEFRADTSNGFGIEWTAAGVMAKCGRWVKDNLVEPGPVPRSKIPIGSFLSAAARTAPVDRTLLLPYSGHYVGEFDDEECQPHGEGTAFFEDGEEMTSGEWLDGALHGFGLRWDEDGELDECGSFENGELIESRGVPPSKVPASPVHNEKAAAATLLLPDGGHFVGDLSADYRQHGQGIAFHANGKAATSGHWTDGQLHGLGVTWDEDGIMEKCGRFERGRLVAECPVPRSELPDDPINNNYDGADLLLPEGGRYVGQLNEHDQQHGQGVEFKADGSKAARGQWCNGKLHGRGKSHRDNVRYEGNFVEGQMSGLGVFTWPAGDAYEGEFCADVSHGFGIQRTADGKVDKCGRWVDDKLAESCPVPRSKLPVGKFLSSAAKRSALLFPDGIFYRGELNAQFQRHGTGSMHSARGKLLRSGMWRHDKLQQRRRALLIGNNAYGAPDDSLRCCGHDAKDMQKKLKKLGFKCTLLLDATRRQMNDAIRKFIATLQPNDIVFIHFSGHGAESEGRTYLLPVDFCSGSLRDDAVSLENLQHDLNEKNLDLVNILMLDCCRYDSEDATFRGAGHRLARASGDSFARKPTRGQFLVAYSSDRGTVAHEDATDRNGWFTGCVLKHLTTPGLQLEQIFKNATRDLQLKSAFKQRSWIHLTMHDDIVLLNK